MKHNLIISTVLAACLFSPIAFGADETPNPYKDCGIGAALFQSNKVLASTSNVIWDYGTTAITSATASPETCEGYDVEVAAFILNNYDRLVEETANGNGEYLSALINKANTADTNKELVIDQLRDNMSNIVARKTYIALSKADKSAQYYNGLMSAINQS